MFAQLGDVPFELLNSFTDLEETHEAQFAKHEVLQGRPRLQAMGNALTELKFGIRLHWRLGDVDAAYKGLVAANAAKHVVRVNIPMLGSLQTIIAGMFITIFAIELLLRRPSSCTTRVSYCYDQGYRVTQHKYK